MNIADINAKQSKAILIRSGHPIAQCFTSARDGAVVECCFRYTIDGDNVTSGAATITRNRETMTRDALSNLPHAIVCWQGTGLAY